MHRRASFLVPVLALSACSWGYDGYDYRYGHDYGGYRYHGRQWAPGEHPLSPRAHRDALSGPGVEILDEWLRDTGEGRAIVSLGWRDARRGDVSEDVAHRVNIWFRRFADSDRDMTLTDPEIRRALVRAAAPHLRRRQG